MAALYVSRLGLAELGALQEALSRCTILVKSMVWPYACTHSHPSAVYTSSDEDTCCMCLRRQPTDALKKINMTADASMKTGKMRQCACTYQKHRDCRLRRTVRLTHLANNPHKVAAAHAA